MLPATVESAQNNWQLKIYIYSRNGSTLRCVLFILIFCMCVDFPYSLLYSARNLGRVSYCHTFDVRV